MAKNTTIDEYARRRKGGAADLADSGRDVDHRTVPGAFSAEQDGFVLEGTIDARDRGPMDAAQTDGAIHRTPSASASPTPVNAPQAAHNTNQRGEVGKQRESPAHDEGDSTGLIASCIERVRSSAITRVLLGKLVELNEVSLQALRTLQSRLR